MTDDTLLAAIGDALAARSSELIEFRRDLHAHPELADLEVRTSAAVADALGRAGISCDPVGESTALTVELGASDPVRRILLRADMDALPVPESTGVAWASTNEGVAHACGHDLHTTALLGAVIALHGVRAGLVERGIAVRAVFQPAEEVLPGGAHSLVEAGMMDGVDAAFALHCDPSIDVGQVGVRVGPLTAACDQVTVTLHGGGGHTSRPQLTQDLTYALAKVVTDTPAVLSRRLDPRAGASLVWGAIRAGSAANVIPSQGQVRGTLRILDASAWNQVGDLLDEVIASVIAPYGVTAKVERVQGIPPVVNSPGPADVLRRATLASSLTPIDTQQSLGGEDFAWFLKKGTGAMARLGTRTPGGRTYDLHQGDLIVDEAAVGHGAHLLAAAAVVAGAEARTPLS